VKCTSCNEIHPKIISINRLEKRRLSTGRANTAHFVWKCGLCKRESSAKFDADYPTQKYSANHNGQFAPLVVLDCRGLEFIGFEPRGTWKCAGVESGTVFPEVDMDEGGEWVDYDEKAAIPVGVSKIQGEWSRA